MDTLDPTTSPPNGLAEAYRHLFLTLRAAIPTVDDTPLAARQRDQAAIAQVAGLCPANMAEAVLAAQYAAANAHALRCLALTHPSATPGKDADQFAARANTMMRRAEGALGNLIRLQTLRGKRDADAAAANLAAWTEHAVTTWMRGDAESQDTRRDPDIRNLETIVTPPAPQPPPETEPARPTATQDDLSHTTKHHPVERINETPMISPANHAASAGTTPTDPRTDATRPSPSSHHATHRPVTHFHETIMAQPDPPSETAPTHPDTGTANAPINRIPASATNDPIPRTQPRNTTALHRAPAHPHFPHQLPALGLTPTAAPAIQKPHSPSSVLAITLG